MLLRTTFTGFKEVCEDLVVHLLGEAYVTAYG